MTDAATASRTKGSTTTFMLLGLGTLGAIGVLAMLAPGDTSVKTTDLLGSKAQVPEGFGTIPKTRTRVQTKSKRIYDVLGYPKNSAGDDFFIAVLQGSTKGETWISYVRNGKTQERKFYRALAADAAELKQLKTDFGVVA